MKLTFPSQNDKELALQTARKASLEDCGKMYLYFLEEGVVDETLVETKVAEESLIDENIEQIKL
jgi:hypothetical protein